MKCIKCQKIRGVKLYVIADDLENPIPYCKKCYLGIYWTAFLMLQGSNREDAEKLAEHISEHIVKKNKKNFVEL